MNEVATEWIISPYVTVGSCGSGGGGGGPLSSGFTAAVFDVVLEQDPEPRVSPIGQASASHGSCVAMGV